MLAYCNVRKTNGNRFLSGYAVSCGRWICTSELSYHQSKCWFEMTSAACRCPEKKQKFPVSLKMLGIMGNLKTEMLVLIFVHMQ